jgi:hypothetical protein
MAATKKVFTMKPMIPAAIKPASELGRKSNIGRTATDPSHSSQENEGSSTKIGTRLIVVSIVPTVRNHPHRFAAFHVIMP